MMIIAILLEKRHIQIHQG